MKYRDLLDAGCYETALDLMQNPDNTVTDVAALPGYTDPLHFARALRCIAEVSSRMRCAPTTIATPVGADCIRESGG